MTAFIGRHYISEDGASLLNELRTSEKLSPKGTTPISILARVPSDVCGCPEELWRIDGLDLIFHFEEDGQSEAFIFAGDWEAETNLQARSLDDLRAKAFQWFADIMDEANESN